MARPPTPTQRRYKGRTRANIRSAVTHLQHLHALDLKYRAQDPLTYPNQLYSIPDRAGIDAIIVLLDSYLQAEGPIPSRP